MSRKNIKDESGQAAGGRSADAPQEQLARAIRENAIEARNDGTYYCNICSNSYKSKETVKGHLKTKLHQNKAVSPPQNALATPSRKIKEEKEDDSRVKMKLHLATSFYTVPNEQQFGATQDYEITVPIYKNQISYSVGKKAEKLTEPTVLRINPKAESNSKDVKPKGDLMRAIEAGEIAEPRSAGESYECLLCNRTLKNKQTMTRHLASQGHQNKIPVTPEPPEERDTLYYYEPDMKNADLPKNDLSLAIIAGEVREPKKDGDPYHCMICKRDLANKQSMKSHLSTKTHQNAKTMSKPRSKQAYEKDAVRSAPDTKKTAALQDNLTKAIAAGKVEEPKRDGDPYHCKLCKKDLSTEKYMKNHLTTKTHLKKAGRSFETDGNERGARAFSESDDDSDEYDEYDEFIDKAIEDKILLDFTEDPKVNLNFWCTVCYQELNVYGKLGAHLESKKHNNKVALRPPKELQRHDHANRSSDQASRSSVHISLSSEFAYNCDCYDVKGVVIIFNVLKERPGAPADTINIKRTFSKLGYMVIIHEDFTKHDLERMLSQIQKDSSLSQVGAFIMFILSHGRDKDIFSTKDGQEMSLRAVKQYFTNKGCPYLAGKPKIIFSNFCRGQDLETDGENNDNKVEYIKVQALVDMIVVHASNEGMMALRSKDTGTVFVRSLCEILCNKENSRVFRHVFWKLHSTMKSKRGTTPMAEDHVFKDYVF